MADAPPKRTVKTDMGGVKARLLVDAASVTLDELKALVAAEYADQGATATAGLKLQYTDPDDGDVITVRSTAELREAFEVVAEAANKPSAILRLSVTQQTEGGSLAPVAVAATSVVVAGSEAVPPAAADPAEEALIGALATVTRSKAALLGEAPSLVDLRAAYKALDGRVMDLNVLISRHDTPGPIRTRAQDLLIEISQTKWLLKEKIKHAKAVRLGGDRGAYDGGGGGGSGDISSGGGGPVGGLTLPSPRRPPHAVVDNTRRAYCLTGCGCEACDVGGGAFEFGSESSPAGGVCVCGHPAADHQDVGIARVPEYVLDGEHVRVGWDDKILGEGGHATVYRGVLVRQTAAASEGGDDGNEVAVAVKVFELGGASGELAKFQSEVALLKANPHSRLVQIFGECLLSTGHFALVMELMGAGCLSDVVDDFEFGWEHRLGVARDVADGLSYLHSLSPPLLHRDIKPGNLLLSATEGGGYICKLADFGISKAILNSQNTMNAGTPVFMAPEIMTGERYTVEPDVWSFGLVLWCMAAEEQAPYAHCQSTNDIFECLIRNKELPPVPPETPAVWAGLIGDCLLIDTPKERPTMRQLVFRLRGVEVADLD